MKILHTVQNYWPAVGGMSEAVRQVSEGLVDRGHDVHVATAVHPQRDTLLFGGVQIHPFAIEGSQTHGYTGDLKTYRDFVCSGGFDIVVNFAAQQWATDALLPILSEIPSRKVFVPTGFSGLFWPDFHDYFQKMPDWMRQYDLNVFLSRQYRDAEFAENHGITNCTVIPNGAGTEEFSRTDLPDVRTLLNIPEHHFLIVHVGSHTGLKGHKEAIQIFSRARLREATFLLIGNLANPACVASCSKRKAFFSYDPRQWGRDKQLQIASLNREQTVASLKMADLFLFPSQVECSPLVLFEALAAQTPFLSTDVGNAREIAEMSGGGQILPTRHFHDGLSMADVQESARSLELLWGDMQRRQEMAVRGHAAWRERYTWKHVSGLYEQAYAGLLRSSPRAGKESL